MNDYPIKKTEAEWHAQLQPEQFEVTRHAATEAPFSGKYWDHWAQGEYRCVCCNAPLFSANDKFDAGCGWPSYDKAMENGRVERVLDRSHGMVRVEVKCQQCGAHLGHVFNDGPTETGERFCINSAAIDFTPDSPPSSAPQHD